MAINYEYKSHILSNYTDLLMAQRKASMYTFSLSLFHQYGLINYSLEHDSEQLTNEQLERYCACVGLSKELKECERINHAWFERVKRLKTRVSQIVSDNASSFITLTFTDNVLNDTSRETRRKYVARWCKSFGVPYVANIDFGKTTHREHYHVIIACKVSTKTWSYGFMDTKSIRESSNDITRLSKYISKLTNHAIKETTQRQSLIYSR